MHMFSRITEWRRKGDRFQMTIGTLLRGVTFVCETPKVTQYKQYSLVKQLKMTIALVSIS